MAYLVEDVAFYVSHAPYLRLASPHAATRFLRHQLDLHSQTFVGVERYPREQAVHLEFFYETIRGLEILDEMSLQSMLEDLTWRGVVWGGWLSLMKPKHTYARHLSRAKTDRTENLWAVACARAHLGREPLSRELAEVAELADQVRDIVSHAEFTRGLLRERPSAGATESLHRERDRVRAAYHAGGLGAARAAIERSPVRELLVSYEQWRREASTTSPSGTTVARLDDGD